MNEKEYRNKYKEIDKDINCSDCQTENLIQPCEACICNPRKGEKNERRTL